MPSSKRPQTSTTQEAAPAYLTRSVKRRLQQDEQSSLPIPDHLVRHCLSFVGVGSYFYIASVSKQVKRCVEMEFPSDRSTSAESIVASKHSFIRFRQSTPMTTMDIKELQWIEKCIKDVIFCNDRVDLFEFVYANLRSSENDKEASFVEYTRAASIHCSRKIMKRIISKDENISKMKEVNYPFLFDVYTDHPTQLKLATCVPSTCDSEMIIYLREKGVQFDIYSVAFALIGGRIESARCLFDFVSIDEEELKDEVRDISYLFAQFAVTRFKGLEAVLFLKEKKLLNELLLMLVLHHLLEKGILLENFKLVLNSESDFDRNNFQLLMRGLVDYRRLDLLEYVDTSVRKLDIGYCTRIAQGLNFEDVVEFLATREH
ncbi:predicted protein [Chaetoceros tenuissimus]|uniref:F-box domain-containing protein n=1 Tax=Chaetoceros tenuissimus TaxID=426638 RepID=A0AAD3H327_9STRA|nr:predicted protein [Chaetoceros tenuissimus]